MENFTRWITQNLRQDKIPLTWLEEKKSEWIPLVENAVCRLLNGETMIIVADRERKWFCDYVISNINKSKNRPYFPVVSVDSLLIRNSVDEISSDELKLILDYLENIFSGRYFFWYIGKDERNRSALAVNKEGSFLCMFDTSLQNNFSLQSFDGLLDIKLMQLYRSFNLTLEAAIFGQISFA